MTVLIAHVGLHKTGTSTVQENFSVNHDHLKSNGWLYPLSDPLNLGRLESNHNVIANLICNHRTSKFSNVGDNLTSEEVEAILEEFSYRVREETEKYGCGNVVLSFEDFCPGYTNGVSFAEAIDKFQHLFANQQIKFLVYLRNQVDWCESWYKWNMRFGNAMPVPRQPNVDRIG